MIRSRGPGFEEREEIDWAFASKSTRSTSHSRAKRVERKTGEEKKRYEREEIASQYLYCLKDPPCQTCCRYNEKLFKALLEQKRKSPPYKHKLTTTSAGTHARSIASRSRISHGGPDEETLKFDRINPSFCYRGTQSSDVTTSTRPGRPLPPFNPDIQHAQPPRDRAPCFARQPRDLTRASESAFLGSTFTRPPSKDNYCGVEAKDDTATTRKALPPPMSVARPDDHERRTTEFLSRPLPKSTDMPYNSTSLPPRIPDGFDRCDAPPNDIGQASLGPLPRRVASEKFLRTIRSSLSSRAPPLQPASPKRIQPISTGEANWRKAEEKEFFCRRSSTCKLCCTDRSTPVDINASGYEPKLKKSTESSSSSVAGKPFPSLRTDSPSLSSIATLLRASEGKSCAESAQSLPKSRPSALSPSDDRSLTSTLASDSSRKLIEPPAIRNPSAAQTAKPAMARPRGQSISPVLRMPPCASDRAWGSERLVGRRIVCKHSPCKPCNISCFDQYYSPNRTRDFDTCYDKPCTLPDIFARRQHLNLGLSLRRQDYTRTAPSWKVAPGRSSPRGSISPHNSSYCKGSGLRDHSVSGKAKWKAPLLAREIYSSPSKSKNSKRVYGKTEWKEMIDKVLLAGR